MRVDIRFWTAIVVIGLCGFAVTRGWGVMHFSLAMANVESSDKRTETAQAWTGASGVASTALKTQLEDRFDPSDWKASEKRRDDLSALLAMNPLSSTDWLSLSRLELVTAQPRAQILGTPYAVVGDWAKRRLHHGGARDFWPFTMGGFITGSEKPYGGGFGEGRNNGQQEI